MLYIVEVREKGSYSEIKFAFDDHNTATSFAAMAKNNAVEDTEVTITLKFEGEVDE